MRSILWIVGSLILCPPLMAQNWVKVADESQTTSVSLPAGTTYRLGSAADGKWSIAVTVMAAQTFNPLYYPTAGFPFDDPDVSITKELDVLQTSAVQTVTVNGAAVPISALPVVNPTGNTTASATVTTADTTVTTTAPVVPAQTITITTPKAGGKLSFTIPGQTLKPLTANVPGQTATINLNGYSGTLSCGIAPGGSFVTNPDGSVTITGLKCLAVKP